MKHRNFDFVPFFEGGGGGDSYFRSEFLEGIRRVTKILNFALKIKGGGREGGTCEVLRPCHPHPPKKVWNVHMNATQKFLSHELTPVIHGYDQHMSKIHLRSICVYQDCRNKGFVFTIKEVWD